MGRCVGEEPLWELAPLIIETTKSHDPPSAHRRAKKANGVAQSRSLSLSYQGGFSPGPKA